jgi:hypothetical protein
LLMLCSALLSLKLSDPKIVDVNGEGFAQEE